MNAVIRDIETHIAPEGAEIPTLVTLTSYQETAYADYQEAPHQHLDHEFHVTQTRDRWGLVLIAECTCQEGLELVFTSQKNTGWELELMSERTEDSLENTLTATSTNVCFTFEIL